MRFYLGNDASNFIDLQPDDTIDIVPVGKVVTSVQWGGSKQHGPRWRADYWDGEQMRSKMFRLAVYDGDSAKAKAAAEQFHRAHQSVSPEQKMAIKASDITPHVMKHFRYVPRDVAYDDQPLPLDPYFVGVWLGDGHSDSAAVTNIDACILNWLRQYARQKGWRTSEYRIALSFPEVRGNRINSCLTALRNLDLIRPKGHQPASFSTEPDMRDDVEFVACKHIPQSYLHNSTENRLNLLAGLIDTDGHLCKGSSWEIHQKSDRLIRDIKKLAESLGFFTRLTLARKCASNTVKKTKRSYGRLIIYASRFAPDIPVLITKKRYRRDYVARNHFYPEITTAPPSAAKKVVWSAVMDAHLLAIKGTYGRGKGTDWKRMVKEEVLFRNLSVGKLRGRHRDLTKPRTKTANQKGKDEQ
jgi:LAGLIDADG DNA endonuclease family protein